jgi:tol-pal system protein YbgF
MGASSFSGSRGIAMPKDRSPGSAAGATSFPTHLPAPACGAWIAAACTILFLHAGSAVAQTEANRGVVQLLNQVEALNADISRLRGQIDMLTNEVANAQKRQRDMYVDLDTRLRRIEQGGAAKKDGEASSQSLEERVRKLEQAGAPGAIPSPVATTLSTPATPAAAPTPVAVTVPSPVTTNQPSATATTLPPASLANPDQTAVQRAYDNAYSAYRVGDYQGAIRNFESFIKTYPKHPLAGNAQYWIGEAYFQLRDYRAAIEAQRRLLGSFPESAKVPDALLIIGTSESTMGDNAAAKKTYEELIAKYPATDSAEKAKGRLARLK